MRFEERDVKKDSELDRDLDRGSELEKEDELELPEIAPAEVLDGKGEHLVLDAIRMIFEHRQVVVNDLALPVQEIEALEALKAAVNARDGQLSKFVYAEDRTELLEQALAILQPKLAEGTQLYGDLVDQIGQLRLDLENLEEAQDDLIEPDYEIEKGQEGDTDDVPAAGAKPGKGDGKSKPTKGAKKPAVKDADVSLDGPERTFPRPPPSLGGADLPAEPAWRSELAAGGPEAPPLQDAKLTITGPAFPDDPPWKSQVAQGGPEAPPIADVATTVGDAADLAEAQKSIPQPQSKTWWKR